MRFSFIAAIAGVAGTALARDTPIQKPPKAPVVGANTPQGCFSDKTGEAVDITTSMLSAGTCSQACRKADEEFAVAIVGTSQCLCANEYPPKDALVDDEKCSYPCPGYPMEACGGMSSEHDDGEEKSYFSVWNLGVKVNVPNAKVGADDEDGTKDEGDGEGDKGEKGNAEENQSSTTSLSRASGTTIETATETVSESASKTSSTASITPGSNDSEDNDDAADNSTEQTSTGTASATPEASTPADGAASGRGLSTAVVGGTVLAAAVIASLL